MLQTHYDVADDWYGNKFLGIDLDLDYTKKHFDYQWKITLPLSFNFFDMKGLLSQRFLLIHIKNLHAVLKLNMPLSQTNTILYLPTKPQHYKSSQDASYIMLAL